ncbi:MAG: MinD/ParA family protein [Pseudomonadota bacterium]
MSIEAATNVSTMPSQGQNVLTIASGKGGVGKTWLAITLAHALAKTGRKALLFDGDLGLANVDIQLGLMPKRDLGSVVAGKITLEQSVTSAGDAGFSIVAGRSGSGSLALLPTPRLTALRDQLLALAPSYDRVIIDLGAGVDRTVQSLAPARGTYLVVTTDEPTALTDAYAFIKLTLAERRDADIRVIVNLAESHAAGEKTFETLLKACRSFLQFDPKLAGVVRRDTKVRQSIQQQTPLLTMFPNSDAATDVLKLITRLQIVR